MNFTKLFLNLMVFAVVATAISCSRSETLSGSEKQKITQEVKGTLESYYADIAKLGLMAEFAYLDSSSDFFWVPPGYSHALPYDTIAAVIKRNAVLFSSVQNSFETLTVVPLSEELSTYSGRIRTVMTDTTGTIHSYLLVETGVTIKRNGNWKILCGQTSLLPE